MGGPWPIHVAAAHQDSARLLCHSLACNCPAPRPACHACSGATPDYPGLLKYSLKLTAFVRPLPPARVTFPGARTEVRCGDGAVQTAVGSLLAVTPWPALDHVPSLNIPCSFCQAACLPLHTLTSPYPRFSISPLLHIFASHPQEERNSPEALDAVLGGRPLLCLGERACQPQIHAWLHRMHGWTVTAAAGLCAVSSHSKQWARDQPHPFNLACVLQRLTTWKCWSSRQSRGIPRHQMR